MKKKILIPCILLMGTLTACNDGLVTKGVPFKEANITAIDESIKNEKKGSIKKVTIESDIETQLDVKVAGEKASATANATTTAKIDLIEMTVELSTKIVSKSGKTEIKKEGSMKVKKENNTLRTISSSGDTSSFNNIEFDNYFTGDVDGCYSWNFTIGDDVIEQAASNSNVSTSTAKEITTKISDKLMVDGDTAKGTFDVGIKEEVPLSINGVTTKYTKLKYSFKDALLQSYIIGVYASDSNSTASASTTVTAKTNYSYEFK